MPANRLCGILAVEAVGCEVVSPRSRGSEGCVEALFERLVSFDLLMTHPEPWCRHAVGSRESALAHELLSLPRVGLILDPLRSPSDHTVQNDRLLRIVLSRAYARLDGTLVLLLDFFLVPIQVAFGTCCGEIVTMYRGNQLPNWMPEYTR